jgi:DNA-binding transcriptional regulator YiaG
MESQLRMLATIVGNTSITRTLERALRAMGSVQRLAEYLDVSPTQLEDWLSGRRKAPNSVYLRALDLVASGPFVSSHREHSRDK